MESFTRLWKGQRRRTMELNEIFEKLDELQKRLQAEDLSLDDAFQYYKEAMELLRECDRRIDKVEKKVLLLEQNGETHEFE
ncbi:exodeoxyribonuclease VII small subunit [Drancourtella sp. An210]|nr:exodeoxyribonuclease VII small subunit [Drancourtella sp. An210]OUP64811.1 exodeoxyribonuclease VII small subunit [Drancourtella sp. An177]